MKKQNKIFQKYVNIFIIVSKYCYARGGETIQTKDIFVSLVDLFSKDEKINEFFLDKNLNLKDILESFYSEYNLENTSLLAIWTSNFTISDSTIKLLENMESIKENDMFALSLFLDLLYQKNIVSKLLENIDIKFLQTLDTKAIIDDVYESEFLRDRFSQILSLKNALSGINHAYDVEKMKIETDADYSDFDYNDEEFEEDSDWNEKTTTTSKRKSKDSKLFIDTFWVNLTTEASKWNLEPVIGREQEINQLIYTLLRKTKSNPLLVGEAWVWKTAIVEWIAQRIIDQQVPAKLKNKKIYSLDMWTLVAWTKFRWEFEARIKNIIDEAINPENNIILFVDETHMIVWAWNQEWSVDTANIIKPYLARWELTMIGATTFDEYKKYIEKDAALTRRFQTITVAEPNLEDAISLIKWIKHRFEDFHGVNILDEAIEKSVNLSKRYILDKQLPDKAIDLVDEACSRKSSKKVNKLKNKKIDKLLEKINILEKDMKKAVENQDYFSAADYKEEILTSKWKIHKLQSKDDTPVSQRENISWDDIEKVISEKYWISSSVLSKTELEFLKDLKESLIKDIIGQNEAVWKVVNSIVRNKFSPLEKSKPIWTFLFLWASWVGKTYLAELMAKKYFQDEKSLIRINMSEYSQDMSANQLTGSAAWYVGYDEWWILTEAVRKKPYSLVLFDEIEKWSPQVLNILLQILDSGFLEDNKWRKIDFKNTIIILTSNIGAEYFNKATWKVWFSHDINEQENFISQDKKDSIMKEIENVLPVELINRFDDIVFFNPINKELLIDIFNKYYKDYKNLRKNKKWISVPVLNKSKIKEIVDEIYKKWSWVRWVEKYLYNDLEDKVIQKLLK